MECIAIMDPAPRRFAVATARRTDPAREGPRERILGSGPGSLSDAELVQAIIGSGGPGNPVGAVAERAVAALDAMGEPPRPEALLSVAGIGEARACALAAALELGRRRYRPSELRVARPRDLYPHIAHYADRKQERFIVASLSGAHEVHAVRVASVGLLNRTLIHPREVYADAIQDRAAAVVVAHNHPSGRLEPSQEDLDITLRLAQAGRTLGIELLDHLVFSASGFISLKETNPSVFAADP
jgi:DNA repair protein RadC